MICDDERVPTRFLRLLTALALACALLAVTGAPAQAACTCESESVARQAERADVVFSGVLRKQEGNRRRDVYTVDVERIYRGRVTESPVRVTSSARNDCGLGRLRVDRGYVFFAARASTNGDLASAECTGTSRATPSYVADVEQALGRGNRIPQPPAPEPSAPEPEFTRVDETEPTPFTRLAAPGGAMVLVGLLGLLLFRRRR